MWRGGQRWSGGGRGGNFVKPHLTDPKEKKKKSKSETGAGE